MTHTNTNDKHVLFKVRRYDPEKGDTPYYENFTVPLKPGMVVLEGLWHIKEHLDSSLAWRSSCRMGVCGSCGMLVNGKPTLACNTQITDVADDVLVLAPLPNFDIIRDLVPDLQPMFDKHTALDPYLRRDDQDEVDDPTDQYLQSPEELEQYLQFSYCIKCGCCMSACPTVATDPVYSGPQPLAQGYRFMIDSRDGGFAERKRVVAGAEGPWRCHYAGECSRVCPKGVDPARAIQLMKRELVLDYLRLGKLGRRKPTCVKPEDLTGERLPDVPDAPEYTVEGSE